MTLTHYRSKNFNAGPSTLPTPVLERVQEELLNYKNSGMSVMELSHRSKEFDEVRNQAEKDLRDVYAIPENYDVLFLQGGASLQFVMIPMNLCQAEDTVDVINTGSWTKKAISELKSLCKPTIIASSEEENFLRIPELENLEFNANARYAYITSNNTIFGTQYQTLPNTGDIPLIADLSSDILSRRIKISDYGLLFAGAQKNIGPSGLTIAIIRKDLVESGREDIPKYLQFRTHAEANSLYNTPPTFAIYIAGLVFQWIKEQGGLSVVEEKNEIKAKVLYDAIDNNDLYYCPVQPKSRSKMNVVFRIRDNNAELEKQLIEEAKEAEFIGLKGHRSVGGLRASIYNAQTIENIQALIQFMEDFARKNT